MTKPVWRNDRYDTPDSIDRCFKSLSKLHTGDAEKSSIADQTNTGGPLEVSI